MGKGGAMTPTKVVSTLKARGVELWQEGGTLRYRARAGTLTEQERTTLRVHKAALLKVLASLLLPPPLARL